MSDDLPPGFVLDAPSGGDLPPGFVLDKPASQSRGGAMAPNPPPQPGFINKALTGAYDVGKFYVDALKNAPADAVDVGKSVVNAFAHPVDTAKALGSVTAGLEAPQTVQQVTLPNGQTVYQPQPVPETDEQKATRVAPANALAAHYKEAYGSIPQAVETFRNKPVSSAIDLATIATPGGALAKIPGTVGKIGEVVANVGRAVDPISSIGMGVKGIGNAAEKVAANALGGMTGATARDVRAAGRAGLQEGGNDAFWGQFTGKADKAEPVEMAQSGLAQKVAEKNAEYRSGMHDISQDRTVLPPDDWDKIDKAVESVKEKGRFEGAVVKGSATEITGKIEQLVNDWKTLNPESPIFKDVPPDKLNAFTFHTPEGIDALKRAIGDIYADTQPGTTQRVAAGEAYNAVKKAITDINPKYAEVMGDYSDALHETKDIRKTLSLGEKASTDTALGKLQSTSRQTAQTRGRVQMVDELAKYEPNLPYALAGQNMNALAPKGLVAKLNASGGAGALGTIAALMHNPAIAAAIIPTMIASSPKVVGGLAYGGGRAAGMAGRGANAIHLNADTIRALEQLGYQSDSPRRNALVR